MLFTLFYCLCFPFYLFYFYKFIHNRRHTVKRIIIVDDAQPKPNEDKKVTQISLSDEYIAIRMRMCNLFRTNKFMKNKQFSYLFFVNFHFWSVQSEGMRFCWLFIVDEM